MRIELKERPKSPIIIEGFPGFGLVGTIATEFLINHLDAKKIGTIWSEDLLPIATVHESKIIEPLGIFYSKKYNIIIIHALSVIKGLEWEISDMLIKLCKDLKCKELISIEGIGTPQASSNPNTYYFSTDVSRKKALEKIGLTPLKEGIVMGVTGALMLKKKDLSCIFVESSFGLADSKAAAKIIEVLDKYLGLKVDFQPLLKAAEEFEKKLVGLMEKGNDAIRQKEKKDLSYVG